MNPMLIIKLIDLVALAANMAPEIYARYDVLSERMKEMIKEDRDPTDSEWADLDKIMDELYQDVIEA